MGSEPVRSICNVHILTCFVLLEILFYCSAHPQRRKIDPSQDVVNDGQYHETCTHTNQKGLCMYQWECYYTGGKPIGICKHGFQFGACCKHDFIINEVANLTTEAPHGVSMTTKAIQSDVIEHHSGHRCGVHEKFSGKSARIVNGTQTYLGEIPWQVSILLYKGIEKGFQHHCGGALLNENWVVTAAHCVARSLLIELKVRVGEHDLTYKDELYPYRDFKVKKKVIHGDYLSNSHYFNLSFENDIALLELKDPVNFKRHIAPICLPGTKDLLTGRSALVTGWGKREENGTLTNILQKVSIPIISNTECEDLYSEAGVEQNIPEIFLCAGYKQGGSDACSGDSGGPLQTVSTDGRYILSGIVSWGSGCGEAKKPGVYTRISKFVDWILERVIPVKKVLRK